jgi:hypothetical protein
MFEADSNRRDFWIAKNNTSSNISIGDLPEVPVFEPHQSHDILRYVSRAKASHSLVLVNLVKRGILSLTKQDIFEAKRNITHITVDKAVTPAQRDDVSDSGGTGDSFWKRAATVLSPVTAGDTVTIEDVNLTGLTGVFITTDSVEISIEEIDLILTDLVPIDAGTLNGQSLVIWNLTTTKYTGYLSGGNVNYKAGDPAGTSVNYIIKDGTFNLQTPSPATAINKGDLGSLLVKINGIQVGIIDLFAHFDEAFRSANQVYPPHNSDDG